MMTSMHTPTAPLEPIEDALIGTLLTVEGYPELYVKYTLTTLDGRLFTLLKEDIPVFEDKDCYEYDAYAHLHTSVARIVDAIMWQVDEPLSFKFTVDL